jgi:hypothetical protein
MKSHGHGSKDKLMEIRKNRMRPTPNLIFLLKAGKSTPLLMLKSHCSTNSKAHNVFDEEKISRDSDSDTSQNGKKN